MDVTIKPGKYVVAVSGGVDSMVLLHILSKQPALKLVVAHFEHGMREDSQADLELVRNTTQAYKLPFIYEHGNLGAGASEAAARDARYAFLRQVQAEQGAQAIITAHHQDDAIETAILNLIRGTGRRGLSSLASTKELVRPLLQVPKTTIVAYAQAHKLRWREDSTNADERYLRNYIRRNIVPRLGERGRKQLLRHIETARTTNAEVDALLSAVMPDSDLARLWFIQLPHALAAEAMAGWLRRNGVTDFDRKLITRLVVIAKTATPGKITDVNAAYIMRVGKDTLQLTPRGK